MKKLLIVFLLISMTGMVYAEEKMKDLVDGNTSFALDLYKSFCKQDGNIFFSPYSISTALAMTYGGARGDTAREMADALHFPFSQDSLHPAFSELRAHFIKIQKDKKIILNIANALWAQKDYEFDQKFLDLTKKYYDAGLFPLDFARDPDKSRITINEWVEKKTESKIKDLLKEGHVTELTRLVLTNAIYFLGTWNEVFDPDNTRDRAFWLTPEYKKEVPMMFQKEYFNYREFPEHQVLEMMYKGFEVSMVIILPKKIDGLPQLESQLSRDTIQEWTSGLTSKKVLVFFPKFKMTQEFSLQDVLQGLGMNLAFTFSADFSGIEPKKELHISNVIHKAFIEVDEKGTEAAAATAIAMELAAMMEPEPEFKADHPFLFLIKDKLTGSILFMGRVSDPSN